MPSEEVRNDSYLFNIAVKKNKVIISQFSTEKEGGSK